MPEHQTEPIRLSAVVPAYNEVGTIAEITHRLRRVPVVQQIVLVDDGSTDGTRELVDALAGERGVAAHFHDQNRGKGAAVRSGLELVEHEHVIIQDADLEYEPNDIGRLAEALGGHTRVVYGSRLLGRWRAGMRRTNYLGNRILTLLFNRLYGQQLTDVETGYKLFTTDLLRRIRVDSDGFDMDPELSAKLARCGERIVEVPIRYTGRSSAAGKKIRARDAVAAVATLWRYRSWSPPGEP